MLDSGVASALDANGTPQPGYCSQAAPGVGGFDRPELYADPFGVGANGNQRIFFRCAVHEPMTILPKCLSLPMQVLRGTPPVSG
jgi:hypothetical protein